MSENPQHNNQIEQMQDDIEIPFFERPFEEVEDGYIDDRGFYTTLNGMTTLISILLGSINMEVLMINMAYIIQAQDMMKN